jgi:hypothetical protein
MGLLGVSNAGSFGSTSTRLSRVAHREPIGQGVHQLLFDQVPDHAFGFCAQHVERPRRGWVVGRPLQGQQADLRSVAVRHDDLVIAGQVRQRRCRDPNIRVLRLRRHRLSALQQGVSAKGHHHAHLTPP